MPVTARGFGPPSRTVANRTVASVQLTSGRHDSDQRPPEGDRWNAQHRSDRLGLTPTERVRWAGFKPCCERVVCGTSTRVVDLLTVCSRGNNAFGDELGDRRRQSAMTVFT